MQDPGEEIVGSYLRHVLGCDFVDYNPSTKFVQGEIDVIGINSSKRIIYVCEVATHMETGLQYTKYNRPDNVETLTTKFSKDIQYARKYFSDYEHQFMLWSPLVRIPTRKTMYNQMQDVDDIKRIIRDQFGVEIKAVINMDYLKCIEALRQVALSTTSEIKSPIMRFLQIEEKLKKRFGSLEQG